MKDEKCVGCGIIVRVSEKYEAKYCCSGLSNACGCMGLPVNPVICDCCEDEMMGGNENDEN